MSNAASQFTGPRAKLRAVRRHGNAFKAELDKYVAENENALKFELKPPSAHYVATADLSPLPEDMSVIVGEMAYQLRSSLDVLACDLARWSGNGNVSGVYFPIATTLQGYMDRNSRKKIAKLKPELRAMIDALQPYGSSILVSLNKLANTDRHQDLLAAIPSIKDTDWTLYGSGDFDRIELTMRKPLPTEHRKVELLRIPYGTKFDAIHFKLHCRIAFTIEPLVGKPVAETLTEMGRTVEGIIAKFETHCFGVP